ncbi:unnamed protein product [Mucor hiemalis]
MATEYRDEKLVKELEKEVDENECGVFDCLMCFCFGGLGLICIVPKYNKRKFASDRLLLELAKPKNPNPSPAHFNHPPVQESVPAYPVEKVAQ